MVERLKLLMNKKVGKLRGNKAEFARMIGIPYPTVSDWFKGKYPPSYEHAKIICQVFDVSLEWLLEGVGIMNAVGSGLKSLASVKVVTPAEIQPLTANKDTSADFWKGKFEAIRDAHYFMIEKCGEKLSEQMETVEKKI
ncbi:hypothetical protein CCP3SC15_300003 [Gammaproteobacteria bacterium]